MATHSSTLSWKIPWTEETGRLWSMGSLRVRHDWATSLSLSCIGEGNGNPLHCSCLENPRDGRTWWAAIHGVAQIQTRLKRLSSSSSSCPSVISGLVFCDYGFSVSALWCPLATLTVLLGFLLPWTWGISSQLLQQSSAAAPYLGRGVFPHRRPSWPWTWNSSSRPPCARATTTPWITNWSLPNIDNFKLLEACGPEKTGR